MVFYFRGLQNWTMLEQCRVCLYGQFRGALFSRISLPYENKLIYSIIPEMRIEPVTIRKPNHGRFMMIIVGIIFVNSQYKQEL